jgi:hypothetical protein
MKPLKVTISEDSCSIPPAYYVRITGLSMPVTIGHMGKERAEALKEELDNVLGTKALGMLKVINYGLAGRGIEAEFTVGGKVLLSIPDSQQAKFREILVAIRDADDGTEITPGKPKTAYEQLLEDD